jgi:FdhD protein
MPDPSVSSTAGLDTMSDTPAPPPTAFGPFGPLGTAKPLRTVPAVRWRDDAASPSEEVLIEETPVALVFNLASHAVMMATPTDLHDFAVGFAITEELVQSADEITHVEEVRHAGGVDLQLTVSTARAEAIGQRSRRMAGRTGCGICGAEQVADVLKTLHQVHAGGPIHGQALHTALGALAERQTLNAAAGAVHAAAWAERDGTLRLVREDVGRHNALDKLIGALVRGAKDPASGFVVVTSRASFEMVQKAAAFGAPLLAAISGPTALAVRVAEASGLTLVGFVRNGGHVVYTHPRRVIA